MSSNTNLNILEGAETPQGVELYNMTDFAKHRTLIYDDAKSSLESQYPKTHNGVRMELSNVHYADPETYKLKQEKEAILNDDFLSRRLRGTVTLIQERKPGDINAKEEVLDTKTVTLMRVPYITRRGTIINGGNEWSSLAQMRLMPGPYSRIQSNGDLETQFNVRAGTGASFRVGFNPSSATYRLNIGSSSSVPLYPVLKDLGVSDDALKEAWGEHVFNANSAKYDSRILEKVFNKLVARRDRRGLINPTREQQAELVLAALNKAQVSTDVTKTTLPSLLEYGRKAMEKDASAPKTITSFELADDNEEYMTVGVEGLVAASNKLLNINRNLDTPDERDNLRYQKVFRLHDRIKESIKMDAGSVARSMLYKVSKSKNLKALGPGAFQQYITAQIVGNPITTPREQINPLDTLEANRTITKMGPGGLGSYRSITEEAQSINASKLGFIDPYAGPESEMIGISERIALDVKIGSDGRLYQRFDDLKNKRRRWVNADTVAAGIHQISE